MDIRDACKILELSGIVSAEEIKKAYRRACMKYHPDRNPSGEHMMKLINAAYDVLRDQADDLVRRRGGQPLRGSTERGIECHNRSFFGS